MSGTKNRNKTFESQFMYFIFTFFLLAAIFFLSSQAMASQIMFEHPYGTEGVDEYSLDLQQTSDDGYIMTGVKCQTGQTNPDVWLIKTDSNGTTCDYSLIGNCDDISTGTFAKKFGGANIDNGASEVHQTSDGGYIVAARTLSFSNYYAGWVIKTDSLGQTCDYSATGNCTGEGVFVKRMSSSFTNYFNSVKQISDGGFILCGRTAVYNNGWKHYPWLVRLDGSGEEVWQKALTTNYNISECNEVYEIADGYILFSSMDTTNDSKAWLIKTTPDGLTCDYLANDGNCQDGNTFAQTYGEAGVDYFASSGVLLPDEEYVITGSRVLGNSYNIFLIRSDSLGNELWRQVYNGNAPANPGIRQTSDGGFVITGRAPFLNLPEQFWIFKTDPSGNTCDYLETGKCQDYVNNTFSNVFFGDNGSAITATADGGYAAVGAASWFDPGTGYRDFYLVKTDSYGLVNDPNALPLVDHFKLDELPVYYIGNGAWTNWPTVDVTISETTPPGVTIVKWMLRETPGQPDPSEFELTERPARYTFDDEENYGDRTVYAWVLDSNGRVNPHTVDSDWAIFYGLYGDANLNRGVTSLDAQKIQLHVTGIELLADPATRVADANRSTTITSLDAYLVQAYLVGLVTYLPYQG